MSEFKTIFRIHRRENPFVQVDHKIILNENLTWKAKGILVYLLSRTENWKINLADIANRSTDGVSSVRSGMRELQAFGYLDFQQIKSSDGRVTEGIWTVYEEPQNYDDLSTSRKSTCGNSACGFSKDGKSHPNNKDSKNTDGINMDSATLSGSGRVSSGLSRQESDDLDLDNIPFDFLDDPISSNDTTSTNRRF